MVTARGEVWWADLPEPVGSGPGYRRPAVVVQADSYNLGGLRTTLVVLLTSNPRLAGLPGNVLLPAAATGLPKDSVANVTQILTVDAGQLTEYVGDLPAKLMRKIEDGLRQVLDLG